MDAQKFGAFIADVRKEQKLTQAQLAVKLKVTDKAVSRWERGLGFPDINTIEPLADALGLSVPELMKSEKCKSEEFNNEDVEKIVATALDVAKEQRSQERKSYFSVLGITAVILILVLFIDSLKWNEDTLTLEGIGIVLPLFCGCSAIISFIYAIVRKIRGKTCGQIVAFGIFLIIIPIILLAFFFLVGVSGL